jgi:hypothetical protein
MQIGDTCDTCDALFITLYIYTNVLITHHEDKRNDFGIQAQDGGLGRIFVRDLSGIRHQEEGNH